MTGSMDLVWDEVNRASDQTFPGWRDAEPLYWAVSLAAEVGEFCNAAKKKVEGGPRATGISSATLLEELADVYIYLQKTSEVLGCTREKFAAVVQSKLSKIQGRLAESQRTS